MSEGHHLPVYDPPLPSIIACIIVFVLSLGNLSEQMRYELFLALLFSVRGMNQDKHSPGEYEILKQDINIIMEGK